MNDSGPSRTRHAWFFGVALAVASACNQLAKINALDENSSDGRGGGTAAAGDYSGSHAEVAAGSHGIASDAAAVGPPGGDAKGGTGNGNGGGAGAGAEAGVGASSTGTETSAGGAVDPNDCACSSWPCVESTAAHPATPLCGDASFGDAALVDGAVTGLVSGLSRDNVADGVLAVTSDGSVLSIRATSESTWSLLLSTPSTVAQGGYVSIDLTRQSALDDVAHDVATLSFDGRSLVLLTPALNAFRMAALLDGVVSSPDEGPFAAVNAALPPASSVWQPVLSADSLTLYYLIFNATDSSDNGIYAATRCQANAAFHAGIKLPEDLQAFMGVTAISADDLTLFLMSFDYETYILVRASPMDHWTVPAGMLKDGAPTGGIHYNFSAIPTADCNQIFTTCTSGGALQSQICRLDRQ